MWTGVAITSVAILYPVPTVPVILRVRTSVRKWWG